MNRITIIATFNDLAILKSYIGRVICIRQDLLKYVSPAQSHAYHGILAFSWYHMILYKVISSKKPNYAFSGAQNVKNQGKMRSKEK